MLRTRECRLAFAAILWLLATGGNAWAQAWPAKTVRVIVPFGPGGGTDIQGRLLSKKFYESMGQTFVVENRSGAGGLIGAEIVAKSPPDGYTLLFTTAKRSGTFPELPTMGSLYPGFESDNWYAMFFPAGTPNEVISKLNAEIVKALRAPDIRDFIVREGGDPIGSSPEELAKYFQREIAKYAKVIKAGNIRAE